LRPRGTLLSMGDEYPARAQRRGGVCIRPAGEGFIGKAVEKNPAPPLLQQLMTLPK
jgi:hypothetical protein